MSETKWITRVGCGMPDCFYNENFRCTKDKIKVDETSRCLSASKVETRMRAAHTLEPCSFIECAYCNKYKCCFGQRDVGCFLLEPDILQRTSDVPEMIKLMHSAGTCDPRDINSMLKGYKE